MCQECIDLARKKTPQRDESTGAQRRKIAGLDRFNFRQLVERLRRKVEIRDMRLVGMVALPGPNDCAVIDACLCKLTGIEKTPKHAATEEGAYVHAFARAVVEGYVEHVGLDYLYMSYV